MKYDHSMQFSVPEQTQRRIEWHKVALIELQKKLAVADCQIVEGRLSEHEQVFGKLRARLKAQ